MQIRLTPAQIQYGVGHQLTGQVVGHLTTAIDPMQRRRWLVQREMQMLAAGPAPQGVTGLVLQQPDRLRQVRLLQQTLLPVALIGPGPLERHGGGGLNKNCGAGVCRIDRRN